jgi:hypothetical protein
LDDGELDHFQIALRRLGVDFERRLGERIGMVVEMPRDILVTTWRRALKLPRLQVSPDAAEGPVRVCVHSQDFLPLRDRLRREGFHYLVHSLVHPEALRLFMLQLLYRGVERRGGTRLPVGSHAIFEVGSERRQVNLIELSLNAARLLSPYEIPAGLDLTLFLPSELSRGQRIAVQGRSLCCVPSESDSAEAGFCVVIEFTERAEATRSLLEDCIQGRQLGTKFSPLEVPMKRVAELGPEHVHGPLEEQRRHARVEYARTVPTLSSIGNRGADVVLGSDLSVEGMRLAPGEGITLGTHVTLALHGTRDQPMLLEAEVVRDDGEHGVGLRFVLLSPADKHELEKLIAELKPIESLREETVAPLVVSRVVDRND